MRRPSNLQPPTSNLRVAEAEEMKTQIENRKPRVLLLGKLPPPYMGPALATEILLKSSLTRRFEVAHVNTNVHEGLDTIGTADARKVFKNLSIYREFLRALRATDPDLVVVPISQSTIGFLKDSLFILLARAFGQKVLVQLRGGNLQNWLSSSHRFVARYAQSVLKLASGAIVLGEGLRGQFDGIFPDEVIYVVPNGADYAFGPRAGFSQETVKLLYLGNLQPSKGIEDVIRAAVILKESGMNYRLDVVGAWRDAATEKSCCDLVERHSLPVTFHGPVYGDDREPFLSNADVFVFTPRAPEGHPWVIVEALAAGLPVVATAQGAIPECIEDGRNGFLVPAEDPEAIADRLRTLIGDPERRIRQARESRRRYELHFTEARMVDRFSRAIEGVLAN